jgi:hypothetical protein
MRYVCIVLCLMCLLVSRPADACQCVDPSLGEAAAWAKVAFVGTITKVTKHKDCEKGHEKDDWCVHWDTYDVVVEGVWKGNVVAHVVVSGGAGCGDCSVGTLGKVQGQRWLFLGSAIPLTVRMCSGTRRATDAATAYMTKKYGAPKQP